MAFKRYLFEKIQWNSRLIGIKGARGTGKTTMILQWLKQQDLPASKAAYFTLDDLYFTQNTLKETVRDFYLEGGKILILDEVHKYPDWSAEVKNCYDLFPDLKMIFTGSSIIDISKQEGDLSRRAVIYELPGLSYREYLSMKGIIDIPAVTLEALLAKAGDIKKHLPPHFRPLEHMKEYLAVGYYPFALMEADTAHQRINQLVRTIVSYDMAEIKDLDGRQAKKILQLIYIIAQQVPFKPNLTTLAEKTAIPRNSLNNYLSYLEDAKILSLLYPAGNSTAVLQKPEKVFLNNTNLLYALADESVDKGSVRETFFMSQVSVGYKVYMPKQGDFLIDNKYTFEIGGKGKTTAQIKDVEKSYLVKDDIEIPVGNTLPLWMFGLLY